MEIITSRKYILQCINNFMDIHSIMDKSRDLTERGFIYETIAIILIIVKQLIPNYEKISSSKLTHDNLVFKEIKSVKDLLGKLRQGNNESDINVKINSKWTPFSVKYRDKCESRLSVIQKYMDGYSKRENEGYNLGYICKDKGNITKHHDIGRDESIVIQKAKDDGYLFDMKDVSNAYKKFQEVLKNINIRSINDLIIWIDKTYLGKTRIHLNPKFHQGLALILFEKNIKDLQHCLSHKPRSGKTITLLLMAKTLLKNGYKRILIMTSIPDTLEPFVKELNKYYEFKDIKYKSQNEFNEINDEFEGILLCSVQFLKNNHNSKKNIIKLFDAHIFDECHFHSSNGNTSNKIININDKKTLQIFASGTSEKTEWFYDIPKRCIYKWSMDEELIMKKITK